MGRDSNGLLKWKRWVPLQGVPQLCTTMYLLYIVYKGNMGESLGNKPRPGTLPRVGPTSSLWSSHDILYSLQTFIPEKLRWNLYPIERENHRLDQPFEKTWSSIWIISPKEGWTKMFATIALISNCFQQHNTTFQPLKSNKIYCIPTNLPAACHRLQGLSFVFGIYKPLKQWRLRQMTICITYYITKGFRYLIWR